MEKLKIKTTSKYPTTLIVKGLNNLGVELANTLLDQEGYVIIVDELFEGSDELISKIKKTDLLSILDIKSIPHLEDDLRRLDYVFYFSHETRNLVEEISSQQFLQESNYLDNVLDLSLKFESRFLLTTSIKAHQIYLNNKNKDILNDLDNNLPKYSETEIQRYAENLVNEYANKMNLDTRIIRIGEQLGEAFIPEENSNFTQIIKSAVEKKEIVIQGDGLETDFYIHYLDTAKGLIKAMFSFNTRGKIFSLAIPEEISILSIAYKLIDLEPEIPEIKFATGIMDLPPLRLYRPAPNLMAMGWEPKITIERALSLTVEFLRTLSITTETPGGMDNEVFEDKVPEQINSDGALARLIAERRIHEKSRTGSVVLANENLRKKVKGKETSGITYAFDNTLKFLKERLTFLKDVTVREFVFYIFLFVTLAVLYFVFISPALNLSRNYLEAYTASDNLVKEINNNNIPQAYAESEKLFLSLTEIQKRLLDLNYVFILTGNISTYTDYQTALENIRDYIEGLSESLEAIEPLYSTFQNNTSNLVTRLSSDSLLDSQSVSSNTPTNLISQNQSKFQLGVEKMRINKDSLNASLNEMPQFVKDHFQQEIIFNSQNFEYFSNLYNNYQFIDELLGLNSRVNYLVAVQDNTSANPAGGKLSGYILFTVENSVITAIRASDFSKLKSIATEITDNEKSSANLVSDKFIGNSITLEDLNYIEDTSIRSAILEKMLEANLSTNIDLILWMNLTTVQKLLDSSTYAIDGVQVNSSNIFSSLMSISAENSAIKTQKIANLSAQLFADLINNKSLIDRMGLLFPLIQSKDVEVFSSNPRLKSFANNFATSSLRGSDYLIVGINISENKLSDRIQSMTLTAQITIKEDGTTSKTITLNSSSVTNKNYVWTCQPSGNKDFDFNNTSQDKISTNFSSDKICNIFSDNNLSEVKYKNNSLSFENNANNGYNYLFTLVKPKGVDLNYEIEFKFESAKVVTAETTPQLTRINQFVYSGKLEKDIYFKFNK